MKFYLTYLSNNLLHNHKLYDQEFIEIHKNHAIRIWRVFLISSCVLGLMAFRFHFHKFKNYLYTSQRLIYEIRYNASNKPEGNRPKFPQQLPWGSYLCDLDMILKTMFSAPLGDNNIMKNPLDSRNFTRVEQHNFITDFCEFFLISPENFFDLWMPYRHDPLIKQLFRSGETPENIRRFQELHIKDNVQIHQKLSETIENWVNLTNDDRKRYKQLNKDKLWAYDRLLNFLKDLPEDIFDIQIKKIKGQSFTFRELFDEISELREKVLSP